MTGLCHCGCGEPAPIATRTRRGYTTGQPVRFIRGHNGHGQITPTWDRFWAKVDRGGAGGCWLWTAACTSDGYGQFLVGSRLDGTRRMRSAHQVAYEFLVSPVPEGLELDHLCRVRRCVNPAHMESVTHLVNVARGEGGRINATKTHCPKGHPYDEINTYRAPGRTHRQCRECMRQKCARRRERRTIAVPS